MQVKNTQNARPREIFRVGGEQVARRFRASIGGRVRRENKFRRGRLAATTIATLPLCGD